jgi:hypothetical protein
MASPLRTEQEWARAHPVPESSVEDMLLSLWNFPVAKSDLSPEHRAALKRFIATELLAVGSTTPLKTELFLRGHASDTGDENANLALSRDRAEKVARFLRSEGFPARQIAVEWAGSAEPADPGSSGLAAARNRRVDVLRFVPSEPEQLPPVDRIEPPPAPPAPKPTFKLPAPTISNANIEIVIPLDFPTYRSPNFSIGGKIEVTFKGKATDNGGGITGGIAFKPGGGGAAKVEAEIADHVKAKFAVEPNTNAPGIVFKGGAQFTDVRLQPEIGLQNKDTFIYINLTLDERPFPEFEIGGLRVSGNITIKGKLEFAPGPALLLRFGLVASPIIVAALILGATVYGIDAAAAEQLRFARLMAAREGIASRVAYEIIGVGAESAFADRRLDWRKTDAGLEAEFIAGVNEVNALMNSPEARKAWTDQWKKNYSADGNQDFTTLRERVFAAVGKYEPQGTLSDAMSALVLDGG